MRRLDALERQLPTPPSYTELVLRSASDEQLDALEDEIIRDRDELWVALVAAYQSGERSL